MRTGEWLDEPTSPWWWGDDEKEKPDLRQPQYDELCAALRAIPADEPLFCHGKGAESPLLKEVFGCANVDTACFDLLEVVRALCPFSRDDFSGAMDVWRGLGLPMPPARLLIGDAHDARCDVWQQAMLVGWLHRTRRLWLAAQRGSLSALAVLARGR